MNPLIKTFTGPEVAEYRDAVATLRIRVFREFPYLYEGTMAYEQTYLQRYLECSECIFVLVLDGTKVVGASTGLPMAAQTRDLSQPFREQGFSLDEIFYFGESILLPAYRGRGIGNLFFDKREAFARRFGRIRITTFCAVERPKDHPRRPEGYRPLDAFWIKRGYEKQPHIRTHFNWKEIGDSVESEKSMTFWTRPTGSPS